MAKCKVLTESEVKGLIVPFVYDSDHISYPIFLKYGMWITRVINKTRFDGQ